MHCTATVRPRRELEPAKLLIEGKITNIEFAGTLENDRRQPADCAIGSNEKRIVHTNRLPHSAGVCTAKQRMGNLHGGGVEEEGRGRREGESEGIEEEWRWEREAGFEMTRGDGVLTLMGTN